MMNQKMVGLLAIAVLAMGLIALVSQRGEEAGDPEVGTPVLPGLKDSLAAVDSVTIQSAGLTSTILRADGAWLVAEKNGYAADFDRLAALLTGLAEAKLVERKTAKPENHARLGLASPDLEDSEAVLVTIAAGKANWALLLGDSATARDGSYARRPDDNQVWLISEVDSVESDPVTWIDAVVVDVASELVSAVTMTSPDGALLRVEKNDESGNFDVAGLPEGAELRYPTVASSISRALSNVRATDVRVRGEDAWPERAAAAFTLGQSGVIQVQARQEGDAYWLRFDLDLGDEPAEAISTIDQARLEGWDYQVASFTYDQFTKTLGDMIKAPAESGEEEG